MKPLHPFVAVLLIAALVPALASGTPDGPGQEPAAQASVKPAAEKAAAPPVTSGPGTARERTSVFVLLAWLWLSIAVLLWLLRLRVREADRVFLLGLDRPREKASEDDHP